MANARTLLSGVLILSLPSLFGCGGDRGADAAACGVTTSCGGDVVGTWVLQGNCALSSTNGSCITSTNSISSDPPLRYVFRADGTFTLSGTFSGAYSSTYSRGCSDDGGATCAQLDDLVQKSSQSPDASLTGGRCQESGEDCCCTLMYRPSTVAPVSGTYRIEGATLRVEVTTATGTGVDSVGYCVRGNALHLVTVRSADGGATSGTTDVLLVRQ